VFKGLNVKNGKFVAIKEIRLSGNNHLENMEDIMVGVQPVKRKSPGSGY
jgi:hypothetical protein